MRYFKIVYDYSNSDDRIFLHFDEDDELPFDRYDVYASKHLPVTKLFCTITKGRVGDCDYLANDLAFLVVSEKAKAILETYKLCKLEFVEVYEKGSNMLLGYLVNCLEHFAAFDEENAQCQRFPDDPLIPLIIIRFAIFEDKVKETDFFQLQEDIFPYFVSEKLKKAMISGGLTGFDFERVLSPKK